MPLLCPGYANHPAGGIERPAEERLVRIHGFQVPFDPEDRWVPARRFRAAGNRLPAFDLIHIQTPFAAHRAGFRVSGYGNGSVSVDCDPQRLPALLDFAMANEVAHPVFKPVFREFGMLNRD